VQQLIEGIAIVVFDAVSQVGEFTAALLVATRWPDGAGFQSARNVVGAQTIEFEFSHLLVGGQNFANNSSSNAPSVWTTMPTPPVDAGGARAGPAA
jgi:hypothetical protein